MTGENRGHVARRAFRGPLPHHDKPPAKPPSPTSGGYVRTMSEGPAEPRVRARAELLPEEEAVGSPDPELQARAILAESDERTEHPERTRHSSTQTPDAPH